MLSFTEVSKHCSIYSSAISPKTFTAGNWMGTLCILSMAAAEASQISQSLSHSFGHFGFLLARTGVGTVTPAFTSEPPPSPQATTATESFCSCTYILIKYTHKFINNTEVYTLQLRNQRCFNQIFNSHD